MELALYNPSYKQDLLKLASNFFKASPFKGLNFSIETAEIAIDNLYKDKENSIIILCVKEGNVIGFIIGVTCPLAFSTDKVVTELAWWVEPEHRLSRAAFKLIDAYEYWANNVAKAKLVCMNSLNTMESVDKIYQKRGYTLFEKSWVKEV